MEYKYMYVYKTTNKINDKFYYGIHRTNKLEDGYLGSGAALREAIRKYGKDIFRKEIIKFFKSEEELIIFEEELVTEKLVQARECYNLVLGGGKRGEAFKKMWASPVGERLREKYSKEFSGYNNPDFKKSWQPKYDEVKPFVMNLIKETSLPDMYLNKQIKTKYGYSFKFWRLLSYYESIGELNPKTKKEISGDGFFSFSSVGFSGSVKKTFYQEPISIYKAFIPEIFSKLDKVLGYLLDETISDSMLFNNVIKDLDAEYCFGLWRKYFEYLGLIEGGPKKKISLRKACPQSQIKWGTKTIFTLNENFKQDYYLIGENLDEQYTICFDGTTFQCSRL